VSQVFRVEEALDGLVQCDTSRDEDRKHHSEARELLAPEAAEEERGTERNGGQRIAEVVNEVGEQRDRVREQEDRELGQSGQAEDRKAECDCFDTFARSDYRTIDKAVGVAMGMRVIVMAAGDGVRV